MNLHLVGCSHHESDVRVRERLAFSPGQVSDALKQFREQFPDSEAVLISTCNRVEMYTACTEENGGPSTQEVVEFLAGYHQLSPEEVIDDLFERSGEEAARHLFTVAASLDSMVVGEAQILSQVKQAYDAALADKAAGPLTNPLFQRALHVAKRVANETDVHQNRVSIPSVAVAVFAKEVFEWFEDKKVLVFGAGEMGEETLTYLMAEGARDITVVNRSRERAEGLAARCNGQAADWEDRFELLATADLVVSTTGASEPIVTKEDFKRIEARRKQKTLLVIDLAVPRDFDPAVGDCLGVYLCSIDDLKRTCEQNRRMREKELPRAEKIIEEETTKFLNELRHRSMGPTIQRLKSQAQEIKQAEVERLFNKLGDLPDKQRKEIEKSFDRVVNKILFPPLKSLQEDTAGSSHSLLDAMKKLFGLSE